MGMGLLRLAEAGALAGYERVRGGRYGEREAVGGGVGQRTDGEDRGGCGGWA